MKRDNLRAVTRAGSGVLFGILLALQAGAQGQSAGARPSGATGGAAAAGGVGHSAAGADRGWPREPEVQAPSRLPEDKAFGVKGTDASTRKADNAEPANDAGARQDGDCARAEAAIAAAGTGGSTAKGQGGAAGGDGRAKAAEKVCSPGHTAVSGQAQATIRANEHAQDGLEKAQSEQASDAGNRPAQEPPR